MDNKDKKDKIIDVTRPKSNSAPRSNIDASRVSSYTMHEQQSLEKLKKSVGGPSNRGNGKSKLKTMIAIILVVLVIILLIAFIIILSKTGTSEEEVYDVRISMQIENKDTLTIITDSGKEALKPISPGDTIDISAYARNSNDYRGDTNSGVGTPPNIYVRFRIRLILNYEERYDILIPTLTDNWYRYDAEKDADANSYDDHYYYFCGSVAYQRRIELFSSILVSGDALVCEDADIGKYGQIQVTVDSIEANVNYVSDKIWPTAPKTWVAATVSGNYNSIMGGLKNE